MLPNKKFTRVNWKNLEQVKARLAEEGGYIVTVTADDHGRYRIYLLNRPTFENNNTEILIRRTDRIRQNHEPMTLEGNRGREYRLSKKDDQKEPSTQENGHETFDRLCLTPRFEFQIVPIRDERLFLGTDPYLLFVRENISLQPAFNDVMGWLVKAWNGIVLKKKIGRSFKLSRDHVHSMIAYMLDDLRTGRALRHNSNAHL